MWVPQNTLEESLAVFKTNFEKTDGQLRESCKEIAKGNSIIQHLQGEIKQLKGNWVFLFLVFGFFFVQQSNKKHKNAQT